VEGTFFCTAYIAALRSHVDATILVARAALRELRDDEQATVEQSGIGKRSEMTVFCTTSKTLYLSSIHGCNAVNCACRS